MSERKTITLLPYEMLPRDAALHPYDGAVRQCSRCRRVQPVTEFDADATKAYGMDTWCRLCFRENEVDKGRLATSHIGP